jgi:hypothetical protein
MLVEAAGSVGRMKGVSTQHARLLKRRGMGRAQLAVAHSILVSAYHMLKNDRPYADLGADRLARRNDQAHTRRRPQNGPSAKTSFLTRPWPRVSRDRVVGCRAR